MDAKVVHINFKPLFGDHISEDVIHKCLKRGWGIAEAKEHHCGFKETKGSNERSLPLISVMDSNVVVPPTNIEFGTKSGVFHVINEFRDKW